jgi:hypothetical protein
MGGKALGYPLILSPFIWKNFWESSHLALVCYIYPKEISRAIIFVKIIAPRL